MNGLRSRSRRRLGCAALLSSLVLVGLTVSVSFAEQATPLSNEMCPVMPDERAEARHWADHEGQRVYFCCRRCVSQFRDDPSRYIAVLAQAQGDDAPTHGEHAHGPAHDDEEESHEHEHEHEHGEPHDHLDRHDHDHTAGHDHAADHTGRDHEIAGHPPRKDAPDHHDHVHDEMPALIHWLGNLHVIVVHFPVGLLIAAALAELIGLARRRRWFFDAARFCVWAGGIGAVTAAPLGWFNAGWNLEDDGRLMATHRWLGTTLFFWAIGLIVLVELAHRRPNTRWRYGYWVALFAGALLVTITGHFGGALIFGPDYLW